MSSIKEILKKSPVFSSLVEDDIQKLEPLFEKREIHIGDILANAKDVAGHFFLLSRGSILLAMDKGKSVVLNTAGDFIGMELLSARGVYKTTVTVLENGSLFAISRQGFLDVVQEDSPAAAAIMAAWQGYLDKTASFAKNIEDESLLEHF